MALWSHLQDALRCAAALQECAATSEQLRLAFREGDIIIVEPTVR